MKKILNVLLATILFIPMMVNAAQCDTAKVYISSISIDKATGNVIELDEATAKDKKVNLNLRMATKDDEILYKVVLKNDSSEDYEINKNSIKLDSDYLEYSLESDNNNIVKANSTRTIYLRVKYATPVDPSKFVNGVYQDNITMKVNLRTDDVAEAPANPKTGVSYIIIISLILIIIGLSLIIFRKKKLSTLMVLVGLILLPVGVNALCTCEIIVDSKVTIRIEDEGRTVLYSCTGKTEKTYPYKIGMTYSEYLNSTYFSSLDQLYQNDLMSLLNSNNYKKYIVDLGFFDCVGDIDYPNIDNYNNPQEFIQAAEEAEEEEEACYSNHGKELDLNDKMRSKYEGALVIKNVALCEEPGVG